MKKQCVGECFAIKELSNCHKDTVKDFVTNMHVYGDVRRFGCSIDNIFRKRESSTSKY